MNFYPTKIKDVDYKILMLLDDKTLLNTCLTDKSVAELCRNETFWYNRFVNKFGLDPINYKPKGRTWKMHYLKVITDLDRFSDNPWEFFRDIVWQFKETYNFKWFFNGYYYTIKNAPEYILNAYRLLNLGNKITLSFAIDRKNRIPDIKREYISSTYFTPVQVLKIIENFYEEPISKDELAEHLAIGNPDVEGYTFDDADKGLITRINMMDVIFNGISKLDDGSYAVNYTYYSM